MDAAVLGRAAVTIAVLLGSLGYVTWRQSRALEALAELDDLRRNTAGALALVVEIEREIQVLASRARIVPEARAQLGMHTPDATELVILLAEPAQ